MAVAVALSSPVPVAAQQGAATPGDHARPAVDALKRDLVVVNRILFEEGFLDTAGHVSVRLDADRYLMAWRRAPELVVVDDVMEYDLDGNVNDARTRPPYLERFIHGEIYRVRPDIRAVVHGHTESLVAFSSSHIPLRPVISGARFVGASVPALAIDDAGGGVNTSELGRKLAGVMANGAAVLMRGHGVVVAAPDLVALVSRALALDRNARIAAQLISMGDSPIYLRPADQDGGAAAPSRGPGGDDANRDWEAWARRVAALLERK